MKALIPFIRVARLLPVVLLLAAVLTGVSACNGGGEDVDPDAVLKQASTAMKEVAGFHFVYEVHKPASAKPAAGLDIARITGDVNSEGNMQATIDVTQGGVPLQLGFVAVGDTHYIQAPPSQKWQSIPAEKSPVGSLSLSAGTIQILDRITDTAYEGRAGKGGTETYHISGMVAAEEVEAIVAMVNTTDSFPTDIWIGVEDSLVYEVDIKGAATPSEDPDIWRSIVLSDLDTFVDIQPPQ
jgi:predicted small secreted protein